MYHNKETKRNQKKTKGNKHHIQIRALDMYMYTHKQLFRSIHPTLIEKMKVTCTPYRFATQGIASQGIASQGTATCGAVPRGLGVLV